MTNEEVYKAGYNKCELEHLRLELWTLKQQFTELEQQLQRTQMMKNISNYRHKIPLPAW